PQVVPALEAICLKAMACRPEDRYASPQTLAKDVERWLADEPVSAFRNSALERTGRWSRKNPGKASGIAATVLVGLFGLIIGTAVLGQKNRQLELARQAEGDRAEGERQARQEAQEEKTNAE